VPRRSPISASPPNFSRAARASSQATAASATTGERLDRLHVAPLDERSSRLAAREVDRAERLHERRQRLHRGADDDGRAVRDAALEPARAVRQRRRSGSISSCASDPRMRGEREAVPDLDALHGLDAHERAARPRVEAVGLLRVRAEPGGAPSRLTSTTPPSVSRSRARRRSPPSTRLRVGASDLDDAARDRDRDLGEERLGDATGGDVHCRLPRARALERVADVVVPELEDHREIGVAGRGSVTGFVPLPSGSPSGGHGLIPHSQFAWSRLRTTSASGVPSVSP
jgi:hypothetical protein